MTNITIKTSGGEKIILNRSYKTTPDYTVPSVFQIGINQSTPVPGISSLDFPIPISDGTTNDDGSNTLTGSGGGDNTTDNTSTYKEGAGNSDDTAQNLIANGTSATKTWSISDLSSAGVNCDSTKYTGLWFYIKDSTTLAKFKSSGTALEIRTGADTTTNYYSLSYTAAELSTGWNWLYDGIMEDNWTSNGTPGTLDHFAIIITTNNATDTFSAGDVVYDLLRQWTLADTKKAITSITINESTNQAVVECDLTTTEANGFNTNAIALLNTDSTPKISDAATYPDKSKNAIDLFTYKITTRLL